MNILDTDIQHSRALNMECSRAVETFLKAAPVAFERFNGVENNPHADYPEYKEQTTTIDVGSLGVCTLVGSNSPDSRKDYALRTIILNTTIDETPFIITVPVGGSPTTVRGDTAEEIKDEDGFPEYAKIRLIQCAAALKEALNPQAVTHLITKHHDDTVRVLDAE